MHVWLPLIKQLELCHAGRGAGLPLRENRDAGCIGHHLCKTRKGGLATYSDVTVDCRSGVIYNPFLKKVLLVNRDPY